MMNENQYPVDCPKITAIDRTGDSSKFCMCMPCVYGKCSDFLQFDLRIIELVILHSDDEEFNKTKLSVSILTLCMLGKNFSRRHVEIFFLFLSRKKDLTFRTN